MFKQSTGMAAAVVVDGAEEEAVVVDEAMEEAVEVVEVVVQAEVIKASQMTDQIRIRMTMEAGAEVEAEAEVLHEAWEGVQLFPLHNVETGDRQQLDNLMMVSLSPDAYI